MNRRRIGVLVALLLVVVTGGGGALLWGLQQVPDFYQEALAETPNPELRKAAAAKFEQRTLNLAEEIKHSDEWSQEFTQQQVNGWMAEQMQQDFPELVPAGVSDPRVKFDDDQILIGFHYDDEEYSGIISLSLRPWMVEPNRLAVEIQSVKAGLIPVPLEEILDQVVDEIEREGWRIKSRQSDGNQVLVIYFDEGNEDEPILEAVKVLAGKIQIAGRRGSPTGDESTLRISRLADQSPAE